MSGLKAVIYQLAEHFRNLYPELQIIEEFPLANAQLKMPALSILTVGKVDYQNLMPTLLTTYPNTDNQNYTDALYVVGQYNINLQVDLWCEFKNQRYDYFEKIVDGFNQQFIDNDKPMGLSLILADYHNAVARYDMINYNYEDAEISSQRNEWRVIFSLLVTFPRLTAKTISLMEQIDLSTNIWEE